MKFQSTLGPREDRSECSKPVRDESAGRGARHCRGRCGRRGPGSRGPRHQDGALPVQDDAALAVELHLRPRPWPLVKRPPFGSSMDHCQAGTEPSARVAVNPQAIFDGTTAGLGTPRPDHSPADDGRN